jgi:F-type H+-transporting ATPase subunit b
MGRARPIGGLARALAAALVLAFAAAGPALAAGGGEDHGLDPKRLAFQLLNFGVLLAILIKFGGGAINKALRARYEQMKTALEEATQARAEAETRLKQQEARLARLEQEVTRLRASIRDEAEHEQRALVAAGEERARRIGGETKFLLEQQVKEAELRLRDEVATAAVRIAEEIVRKSLLPDDNQRLVQTFVSELERAPHATTPRTAPPRAEERL